MVSIWLIAVFTIDCLHPLSCSCRLVMMMWWHGGLSAPGLSRKNTQRSGCTLMPRSHRKRRGGALSIQSQRIDAFQALLRRAAPPLSMWTRRNAESRRLHTKSTYRRVPGDMPVTSQCERGFRGSWFSIYVQSRGVFVCSRNECFRVTPASTPLYCPIVGFTLDVCWGYNSLIDSLVVMT